VELWGNFA